jgi:hypothetical protein
MRRLPTGILAKSQCSDSLPSGISIDATKKNGDGFVRRAALCLASADAFAWHRLYPVR